MDLPRISLDQIKKIENGDLDAPIEQVIIETSLAPAPNPQEFPEIPQQSASTVSPPQTLGDLNLVLRTDSSSSDDSDSDDDDDEEDLTPTPVEIISNSKSSSSSKTSALPEKRRRSQPVKFEPSPISPKKHHITRQTPKSVPSKNYTPGKLRGTRCGRCPGCQQEDCGKCVFCKDKPKFGGPGKKKQRCKLRTCSNFQHRTGDKYTRRLRATGPTKPYPTTKNGEALFDGPSTSAGPSAAAGRRAASQERQATSNLLTYSKVAKQLASTKPSQGAKIELEKTPVAQPSTSLAACTSSSIDTAPLAVPVVDVKTTSTPSVEVVNIVKPVPATPSTSSSGLAKTNISSLFNSDKSDSPMGKGATKPTPVSTTSSVSRNTPANTNSTVSKSTPANINSSTSKGTPVNTNASVSKSTPKPILVNAKLEMKRVPDRMTCVQCGRDRPLSIAKTDRFCTQRCINNWQEAQSQQPSQPEVKAAAADEAAGAGPASSGDSPFKPLPRALKKLQIDMAKPGTKLKADSEVKTSTAASTATSTATRSSLINSLASMISQSQTQADPPKPVLVENKPPPTQPVSTAKTPEAVKTVTPAKVAAKRSANIQLASSAAKKTKMATKATPQATPKSVSFNLKPNENGTPNSSSNPTSHSNVIPLIASMFQPSKKSHDSVKVRLPPNLPTDIRQWTVGHVIHYFKSTADCQDYIELFEAQEVDGIALLLLTHETLVKCLGIKLGRALKIMNRVQELKRYQDHNKSTK